MALVLHRAIALLRMFSAETPEIGLSEASRLAGESKATVYRLLTTLCESGLVEWVPARKTYRLGPAVLELARVREATVPLVSVVEPVLEEMQEKTGETCHFSRFNGTAMTVVASVESRRVNRITMVGVDTLPLCSTAAGQVFLAFADPRIVTDALARTGIAGRERESALQKAREVRDQGYATVDHFEDEQIFGLACPVLGRNGRFLGALAVTAPPSRNTEQHFRAILESLHEGCATLTKCLAE